MLQSTKGLLFNKQEQEFFLGEFTHITTSEVYIGEEGPVPLFPRFWPLSNNLSLLF